jgi:hypothetical protein
MAGNKSRVNEEKMLNDMFVLLEYSDSFADFIQNLDSATRNQLWDALDYYYKKAAE